MAESDVAGALSEAMERSDIASGRLTRVRACADSACSLCFASSSASLFTVLPLVLSLCYRYPSAFHSLQDDIDEETRALWKQEAMNRERTWIEVFIMDVSGSAISERARGRSPRRVSLPQHNIGAPRDDTAIGLAWGHTVSSLPALVSDSRVAHRVFRP